MRGVFVGCILATAFWFVMFSPWTSPLINFWGFMTVAAGTLAVFGLVKNKRKLRELYAFQPRWLVVGPLSAAVLYLVFLLGDKVASSLLDFAAPQVEGIYATKSQASPAVIGALLLWIGPAEEIFWRGYVQQRLCEKLGTRKGYLLGAAVYAGVHVSSANFVLITAALISGLFWGWMFLQYKSVWPGLVSHAVWDLTIFVVLPIR